MSKKVDNQLIMSRYQTGTAFNQSIDLYDTVTVNENFFIGKQWEGVKSNGLPTPTFNFLKQVVNFMVATITSDNITLKAQPLPGIGGFSPEQVAQTCRILNDQYGAFIERNNFVAKIREFLRNAAVDGDGCIYYYFDPDIENGQRVKGEIVAEVVENTRVIFGNPNCRDVQAQPYIIIARRELVEDVQERVRKGLENGTTDIEIPENVQPDDEAFQNQYDAYTDDKVTVLMYMYRDRETKTIHFAEATQAGLLTKPYDTGYHKYPIQWMSWDFIHDCYHGQAVVTGLIPNQKFVNKMFALAGISLTTMSFPKIVYDKTRVKSWDGSVGVAVGVNGNVEGVAKTIEGAPLNPQIAQFIDFALGQTKSLLGASDVALGDSRPDNAAAIISLQRAATTPIAMTKQALYQCIDETGVILDDIMSAKFGTRTVQVTTYFDPNQPTPFGIEVPQQDMSVDFDFSSVRDMPIAIRHDAGASSYWSEIASLQTIENLLMNGHITAEEFLQRVPEGYVSEKKALIESIRKRSTPPTPTGTGTSMENMSIDQIPVEGGQGNGQLQRQLTQGV